MSKVGNQSSGNGVARDNNQRNPGRGNRESFGEIIEIDNDHVGLVAHDLFGEGGESFGTACRRKALDNKVLPLNIAQLAQGLVDAANPEWTGTLRELVGGDAGMNKSHPVHLLLCVASPWQKRCYAPSPNQQQTFPSPHSITSSARNAKDEGISRPKR